MIESKTMIIVIFLSLAVLLAGPVGAAKIKIENVHEASNMVTAGCRACHAGSDMSRSILNTCYQCHGDMLDLDKAEKKGILSPFYKASKSMNEISMKRKLEKPYRHPIGEAKGVHNAYEEMPETGSNIERHVECVDCHSPHYMRADRKFAGLKGVTKKGISGVWARAEYEVCFNCHSDSYNLPVDQTNKRLEFAETNPSYHPVIAEGKNSFVPSLIKPYTEKYTSAGDKSRITCSDCHNNDDKRGLQGPHASNYPAILARNYSLLDRVDESPQSYDLCYGCHKRSSILGDISFKYHSKHIKGDLVKGIRGTSCFTCHDAHGSAENTHLIRFNRDVVFSNPSTMELAFIDKGEFKGECSLLCHDVNHNPKSY